MPKGKIKKINVNEKIFKAVLKEKGYSIRKLCEEHGEICSDRTLRRALKTNQIQFKYLDDIAKLLDVDSRFLTGEIIHVDSKFRIKNISMPYYLAQIENYPYSRKELDDLRKTNIAEHLKSILSLFEFSYKQFENLDFDTQYHFQYDLFESIATVLDKYFFEDGYGNEERPALYTLILSLESYYEEETMLEHADTTLREKFIESPPSGYSIEKIKSMSREEIFNLDWGIQFNNCELTEAEIEFDKRHTTRSFIDK